MSEEKTKVNVVCTKRDSYTKSRTASGKTSLHSGDTIAVALAGLTLVQVYKVADLVLDVTTKDLHTAYDHLNDGMQRMTLGNRIRGVINKQEDGVLLKEVNSMCGEFKEAAAKVQAKKDADAKEAADKKAAEAAKKDAKKAA